MRQHLSSRILPKRIALLFIFLVGLSLAGYRRAASALSALEDTSAAESESDDDSPPVSVAPRARVRRFIDDAGFIDSHNAEMMERQLQAIWNESGVDIRFILASEIPGDLESFALRRARELGVGGEANKRGMLFVYDFSSPQRMRIEVGPGLEGIFPDGFVGYLMREQTSAFFAPGDRVIGLKMTLRVVLHRLREAALGKTYNPKVIAYIKDSVRLAAGAGATGKGRMGRDLWARQFGETPPDVQGRFGPQPTVAATHSRYLEALREGHFHADLPLYTAASHPVLRRFPMTPPFRDLILFSEYGHKYTVVEHADLAILFFTTTPLVSPHLFRRSPAGWQLDLAADVRDTEESVGGAYTWRMVMSGDDYTRAFAYLFADCGPILRRDKSNEGRLLRPARGDNRRLPTRNGGHPASCAKNAMAPRPTGTAALILPPVGTQTEDFGYPSQTVDRLVVRRLLQAGAYDTLDTVLAAYADSVLRDYRLEYRLFDAYAAFQVAMPSLEPLLNEWVQERPASPAALLARATFFRASGWDARGGGSAGKTTRLQFQRMENYFRRARIDLAAALRLAPNSIVAYRQLIDMTPALRGDPETSRQLLDRALRIQPYSFILRAEHMHNLLPRWGGSYEAMTEFAEESAPFAKRNPRIRALQGFVDWDRGRVLERGGQDVRAIQAYGRALRFGNLWLFRSERGELYSRLKRYQEALDDFNSLLLQYPQYAEALFQRSWVLYELGRTSYPNDVYREYSSQAFLDIEMSVALDPTDDSHNDWVEVVRKSIPEFEPPARP